MGTILKDKSLTREEIAALASAAGLQLPPQYFEELVQAYRGVEPILARLRRDRPRADEPAHAFDPRRFLIGD